MKRSTSAAIGASLLCSTALFSGSPAHAEDAPPPPQEIKIYGYVEGGFTANVDSPSNGINFGHLFTDRSNEFLVNQTVLTVEKPVDTKSDLDFGFKGQIMFGSDARFTH